MSNGVLMQYIFSNKLAGIIILEVILFGLQKNLHTHVYVHS